MISYTYEAKFCRTTPELHKILRMTLGWKWGFQLCFFWVPEYTSALVCSGLKSAAGAEEVH